MKSTRKRWAKIKQKDQKKINLKRLNNNVNPQLSKEEVGRKKVKRDRSSAYRTIKKLSKKLSDEKKKNETLKKQACRSEKVDESTLTNSPRSKVKSMISKARGKVDLNIYEKLLVGEVFSTQLQEKNADTSLLVKRSISNILANPYFKKYKLSSEVKGVISCKKIRKGGVLTSL